MGGNGFNVKHWASNADGFQISHAEGWTCAWQFCYWSTSWGKIKLFFLNRINDYLLKMLILGKKSISHFWNRWLNTQAFLLQNIYLFSFFFRAWLNLIYHTRTFIHEIGFIDYVVDSYYRNQVRYCRKWNDVWMSLLRFM